MIYVAPEIIGRRPKKTVVEEKYPGKFVVVSGDGYAVYDSRGEWLRVMGYWEEEEEGGDLGDLLKAIKGYHGN